MKSATAKVVGDIDVDTMGIAWEGVVSLGISCCCHEQEPGQVVDEASEFIVDNVVDSDELQNSVNTHVDIF
jgi:hypothetical protein